MPSKVLKSSIYYTLKLSKYRKQVINKNYKNTKVSPFSFLNEDEFYNLTIQNLARIIVESITTYPIKKQPITFIGIDKMEQKCNESNGLILLATHYGNWELACRLLASRTKTPCYGVYKPIKNKGVDIALLKKRSQYGLNLIPMSRIGRVILENRIQGKKAIYILIADQNPNSKNSIVWNEFLGVKTAYFNGPLKLYQKYMFNVSYMEVTHGNNLFEYTVNVSQSIDPGIDGNQIIPTYSQLLENQIRQYPQAWLWSHKRWKRSFSA